MTVPQLPTRVEAQNLRTERTPRGGNGLPGFEGVGRTTARGQRQIS